MSKTNVAGFLVEMLHHAGVKRIYGVAGDSLNAMTESLRKQRNIEWVHVRHEEAAAFAAGAEAHLTGSLAVCAGSCGPGNLHLINGLFDCHRSRVPVLAIAAQIPSAEVGRSYFQETHPQNLFQECSHYCELVSTPHQLPGVFETAIRVAIAKRGVSVVVMPGDIGAMEIPTGAAISSSLLPTAPLVRPSDAELNKLAHLLNASGRVTLLCGRGCADAHQPLMRLANALQSPIVHALGGKESVEWDNPFDVGMTGLIGFSSGYHAMMDCDTLLMLGTDFPYRQFYPTEAKIAQVDVRPEGLGRRCRLELGVLGDVGAIIEALLPRLEPKADRAHLDDRLVEPRVHGQRARAGHRRAADRSVHQHRPSQLSPPLASTVMTMGIPLMRQPMKPTSLFCRYQYLKLRQRCRQVRKLTRRARLLWKGASLRRLPCRSPFCGQAQFTDLAHCILVNGGS